MNADNMATTRILEHPITGDQWYIDTTAFLRLLPLHIVIPHPARVS